MEAESYNLSPQLFSGFNSEQLSVQNMIRIEFNSWLSIEPATIQLLAVKRHEDSKGFIIRVAEVIGKESQIEMTINLKEMMGNFFVPIKTCHETDLLESHMGNSLICESVSDQLKKRFKLTLKPFEIKTLLFS
jgi:alpha-mannosidase